MIKDGELIHRHDFMERSYYHAFGVIAGRLWMLAAGKFYGGSYFIFVHCCVGLCVCSTVPFLITMQRFTKNMKKITELVS